MHNSFPWVTLGNFGLFMQKSPQPSAAGSSYRITEYWSNFNGSLIITGMKQPWVLQWCWRCSVVFYRCRRIVVTLYSAAETLPWWRWGHINSVAQPTAFVGTANQCLRLPRRFTTCLGCFKHYFLRMLYVLTHKAEKQLRNCSDSHRLGPLSCEKFKLSTTTCSGSCRLWRKMANIAFMPNGKILRHSCLCA